MNRRRHQFAIGMTVLMLSFIGVAAVSAAGPKPTQADWESLKQLAPGQQVQVVLNDAKSYSGQFQSVSDDGIVLHLGKDTQTFERQTVLRVSTRGKSHRGRNALIGVGAGVATLLAVDAGVCEDCTAGTWVGDVAGGGLLGSVVGALIPTGRWHDVYRAR